MLNEALALFRVERTRLAPVERLDAVIEIQTYVRDHYALSRERSTWVEAALAIYAAQSLYERREGDKGALELIKADNTLDRWCFIAGIAPKDSLRLALDSRLTKLNCNDFEDEPLLYYKESTELLGLIRRCCHASTTVCFRHAIEAARRLMTASETDPYRAAFHNLLYKLQDYQERVLEDVRGLLFDRAPLFTEASSNIAKDTNKVLEWLEGFEKKNPNFDIPKGLEYIMKQRRMIYMLRRQPEKQAEEEARIKKLKDKLPVQTGGGALVALQKPISAIVPSGNNPKAGIAFPLDIDQDNFFMAWVDVAGKPKEIRAQSLQFLVEWMVFDFTAGVIEDSEIGTLLGIKSGAKESSEISTQLEAMSPEVTYRKLYLSGVEPFETIIDSDRWAEKFEILRSWLYRPSKPTLNGRQYLWVNLQEIRADSMTEHKARVDDRVLEIKRCISMVEVLRPKVKEVVSSKRMLWQGSIADQYFLSCIEFKVFNCEQVGERLALSVDIGIGVIDEFQGLGDVMQTAHRQSSTAEACLYKLYWMLLQPGHTMSDPKLVELQNIGLDYLEKADGYYTPILQDVTWSHGLESVQERERFKSTSVTWRNSQSAVRLLMAEGIMVDNIKRKAIWTWVQRSKARALAMAIGTTSKVPAALLQQIIASEQYRALYDKMLSLQQQIQMVEPQHRFSLRQEMDMHTNEMRKYRPLAELCDIKDGKALTLSDLDTISAVSKPPIVLVEWFYVGLDAYDEGSIILLTAKSGSTPTINVVPIKPPEVARWIDSNLDGEFSGYTNKDTSDLCTLVQPLVNITKPGETLMFCTTSHLNRIPLHSIDVVEDDLWQPLIHRNPVVYIHSHSILRMCLWNAQEAAEAQSPLNPLIVNGIPDIPSNAAWSAGRNSVQKLAGTWNVVPYLNAGGTKANFLTHAPSPRLIHVHSHVEWIESDPLAHSIHFAPPPTPSAISDADTKLSAREVFALSFPLGSHVSLIACSGGMARISPEDEVMGLVPALLHAGASSTLSTLWPIENQAGASFAETFYRKLDEAREAPGRNQEAGRWVDLARVFQDTVLERDKEEATRGRLHWTAFIVHGFWQLWMPALKGRE